MQKVKDRFVFGFEITSDPRKCPGGSETYIRNLAMLNGRMNGYNYVFFNGQGGSNTEQTTSYQPVCWTRRDRYSTGQASWRLEFHKEGGYGERTLNRIKKHSEIYPVLKQIAQAKPDVLITQDVSHVFGAPCLWALEPLFNVPVICNMHGILTSFEVYWATHPEDCELLRRFVQEQNIAGWIAPSAYSQATGRLYGIDSTVIPSGVDTQFFKPAYTNKEKELAIESVAKILKIADLTILNMNPILVFPARAVENKGLHWLLEEVDHLWRSQVNLTLIIAGGTSDNPEDCKKEREKIEQWKKNLPQDGQG